jgi:hypothetical protein
VRSRSVCNSMGRERGEMKSAKTRSKSLFPEADIIEVLQLLIYLRTFLP